MMTLDRAIKILKEGGSQADFLEATKLAIEAMKRLKEYREWHRSTADSPLLGETKEPTGSQMTKRR